MLAKTCWDTQYINAELTQKQYPLTSPSQREAWLYDQVKRFTLRASRLADYAAQDKITVESRLDNITLVYPENMH